MKQKTRPENTLVKNAHQWINNGDPIFSAYNYELTISLNPDMHRNTSKQMYDNENKILPTLNNCVQLNQYFIDWVLLVREYTKKGWPHWHLFISSQEEIPDRLSVIRYFTSQFGRTTFTPVDVPEVWYRYVTKELVLSCKIDQKENVKKSKPITGHRTQEIINDHYKFFITSVDLQSDSESESEDDYEPS